MSPLLGCSAAAVGVWAGLRFGLGLSAHACVVLLEVGGPLLGLGVLVLILAVSRGGNYVAPSSSYARQAKPAQVVATKREPAA